MSSKHSKLSSSLSSRLASHVALLVGVSAFAIGISSPALAQGTEGAVGGDSGVADIVVTAQKREQNLQDVGIAITAFTSEQLVGAGANDSQEIAAQTPGVHFVNTFGGSQALGSVNIRGVIQNDFSPQGEAPVAVYIDNAYASFPGSNSIGLYDVERVEILKGPQGTLFGRNATGGLVHIITKRPGSSFEGHASQTIESYDTFRTEIGIGGPLSEQLGVRLAFFRNSSDGWQKNDFATSGLPNPNGAQKRLGGDDSYAGRIRMEYNSADDRLNALLTFSINRTNRTNAFTTNNLKTIRVPDGFGNTVGVIDAANPFAMDLDGPGRHTYVNSPSLFERSLYWATGEISYDLGGGTTLTSVTNWAKLFNFIGADFDFTGPPLPGGGITTQGSTFSFNTHARQFAQELRLNGDMDNFRWVAGLYYLHINGLYGVNRNFNILGRPILPLDQTLIESRLKTDAYAGFAQGEYDLTDQLTFIAGYRATHDKKDYTIYANPNNPTVLTNLTPAGVPFTGFSDSIAKTDHSFKFELDFKPVDHVLLYGSITRGTKAGSYNICGRGCTLRPDQLPYKGEVLTSYEVGAKTQFWDNRARFNISAYYYDYNDYQSFMLVAGSSVVSNLPAKFKGVDADLLVKPGGGFTLSGGIAYMDTRVYGARLNAPPQRSAFSPKWKLNFQVSHEAQIGPGELSTSFSGSYRTHYFSGANNAPDSRVDGYFLANARIGYRLDSGFGIAFFGNNIFDKHYLAQSFDASALGFANQTPGTPRWLGAEISYQF